MMNYYGVPKTEVTAAIHGMFDLLEKHSPGPCCQSAIDKFRQKDLATGKSLLDRLDAETDQRAFARLLVESGLAKFSDDVGGSLACHAHLDTDKKGRDIFRVLTSTGQLAKGFLNDFSDPLVHESDVWRGVAYAEKLLTKNRLQIAWNSRRCPDDDVEHNVKQITLAGPRQIAETLSSLEEMARYDVISRIMEKCGFDPEGRDIKGKSPMKHFSFPLEVPEGTEPEEENRIQILHKEMHDFAVAMSETTEMDFIGTGIEGRGLKSVTAMIGKTEAGDKQVVLGAGSYRLLLSFKATEGAVRAFAAQFPRERIEGRARKSPSVGKRPLGRLPPP